MPITYEDYDMLAASKNTLLKELRALDVQDVPSEEVITVLRAMWALEGKLNFRRTK